MSIRIQGTTVIDDSRNAVNLVTASVSSAATAITAIGNGSVNTYRGVLRIGNTASDQWGGISFPDSVSGTDSPANNYYFIGRGGAISSRMFSFHIPTASNYGSGSQPRFVFASTGSDELFTVQSSTGNSYIKGTLGVGTTSPSQKLHVVGTGFASSDFRAPIFYDSNNTGFYVDPSSTGTSINIAGSLRHATHNKPGILSVASGSASTGASIAIQQETAEGWTAIFADYEPNTGWGLYHDNPSNYFSFTAESTTGQIRSFTVPSRQSGNRTAYEKFRIDQNNGNIIVGGTGTAQSDFRAPIFYDSNNTAYYVDPASTTSAIFAGSVGIKNTSPINTAWGNASTTGQLSIYGSNYGVLNIRGDSGGARTFSMGVGDNIFYMCYDNTAARHNITVSSSGNVTAAVDYRAPIFYDSNNTAFYVDPASTSRLNKLSINPNTQYVSGMQNGSLELGNISANYKYTSGWSSSMQAGILANCLDQWEFIVHDSGHALASAFCYNGGASNRNFEIGRDIGWGTMYTTLHQSARSPIFYDSNNTGYYVDPASTSQLYNLDLIGAKQTYLQINPGNGYEAMVRYIGGSGSGWYVGKRIASQLVGTESFHFYSEAAVQTVAGIDTGGNVFSIGSMRSPIFYDSNNTGYYLDPNSISRLHTLRMENGGASDTKIEMRSSSTGGYSAIRAFFAGSEQQQIHFFGSTWGSNFTSQSRGAINLGSGVTFGAWNAPAGYVDTSGNAGFRGNVTAYAYSDRRLKHNIRPIFDSAIEKIKNINGVRFEWDEDYVTSQHGDEDERWCPKHDIGVIAQEVQQILPEIVVEQDNGFLAIRYEKLIPVLIEAIKEMNELVQDLQQETQELKETVKELQDVD